MPDGALPTDPAETMTVKSRDVSCDGGDGAYGHPKVYLHIADRRVVCPYCSRVYVVAPGVTGASH